MFDTSNSQSSNAGVVIIVIVVVAWLFMQKRRRTTADLRRKFGPEYERTVKQQGSERKAEARLSDREKRVEKLNIRDLDPMENERFLKQLGVRTVSLCRFSQRINHRSGWPGVLFNEDPRLSGIRFRSASGRYFCRSSRCGGRLQVCA